MYAARLRRIGSWSFRHPPAWNIMSHIKRLLITDLISSCQDKTESLPKNPLHIHPQSERIGGESRMPYNTWLPVFPPSIEMLFRPALPSPMSSGRMELACPELVEEVEAENGRGNDTNGSYEFLRTKTKDRCQVVCSQSFMIEQRRRD